MTNKKHNPDGTCNCPLDGNCITCNNPCSDHDLVGDIYWCNTCVTKSWDEYEKQLKSGKKG